MEYNRNKYRNKMVFSAAFSFLITFCIAAFAGLMIIVQKNITTGAYIAFGFSCALLFTILFLFFSRKDRRRKKIVSHLFPAAWEKVLFEYVQFYNSLSSEEKNRFQQQVMIFLDEKHIYGIETEIDDACRVLIAASAIIPVFGFPDWEYDFLREILVYPNTFNDDFQFGNRDNRNILGCVTPYAYTMILSKPALFKGFSDAHDNQNVGLHEFVHVVDGNDGHIDGIPALLINRQDIQEWLRIMNIESKKIENGDSDINPYALQNHAEFFTVTSEYFFENPEIMAVKHPELYSLLMKIFHQDTKTRFTGALKDMIYPYKKKIGGNTECPCGSRKKYKDCCRKKKK